MKRNTIAAFAAGALFALILFFAGVLSAQQVVRAIGNTASGGAATGAPVETGGRADTATPTAVDDGDIVALWLTERGGAVVEGTAPSGSAAVGRPLLNGGRVDLTKPTAADDGDQIERWLTPTGAGVTGVPVCDGTAVNISATTAEADGTTTDAQLYLLSVTGATAHCIWGATATTTTGFQVPEGSIFYTTSEGTNLSCITVAGTATVRLVPCDYDGA